MVSPSRVPHASGSSLPKPNLDQSQPRRSHEALQPRPEPLEPPTPHHVTPVSHKAKRSIKQVFAKKRFYLDIKSKSTKSVQIKNIIEEIQILGGTIEEFFSKEVTTVISDAPDWKLKSPGTAPSPPQQPALISPPTPCSLQPLSNASWSPATPATPTEDKRKPSTTPKSRVETILERAHVQAQGTCDVIEIAHKLQIHIWSLHKLWKWLEELKKKFGPLRKPAGHWRLHQRSQSVDSSLHSHAHRALVSPYVKFEATTRQHKPVIHEFKRFPKLFLGGKFLGSPFYPPDSSQNKFLYQRLNLEDTRARDKPEPTAEATLDHRDKHAKSTRKDSVRNPPKTPTKKRPATPNQSLGVSAKKRDRPGFCELCNLEFTDLNAHIETDMHDYWGLNASHWVHVDSCISLLNSIGPVAPCLA